MPVQLTSSAAGGPGGRPAPDDEAGSPAVTGTPLPSRRLSSVVARFASVGVVNTLVDFVIFLVLVTVGMATVPANALSTTAGMAVSFLGNRRFVFGATDNRAREMVLFLVVCGTGIWVIQPLVIVGISAALESAGAQADVLVAAVAKAGGIVVAAVWNFVLYGRLVFRRTPEVVKGSTPS